MVIFLKYCTKLCSLIDFVVPISNNAGETTNQTGKFLAHKMTQLKKYEFSLACGWNEADKQNTIFCTFLVLNSIELSKIVIRQ